MPTVFIYGRLPRVQRVQHRAETARLLLVCARSTKSFIRIAAPVVKIILSLAFHALERRFTDAHELIAGAQLRRWQEPNLLVRVATHVPRIVTIVVQRFALPKNAPDLLATLCL